MLSELPPHEFQNQVLSELRQINTRLDKLEADIKKVEMDVQKLQSFQRFWGMGELSIHRWKGFELYPVINKKTVS